MATSGPSAIRLLVLGDDGCGKSSLISSFVSQIFTHNPPPIMTTIRLPPTEFCSVVTTIIDSQGDDVLRGTMHSPTDLNASLNASHTSMIHGDDNNTPLANPAGTHTPYTPPPPPTAAPPSPSHRPSAPLPPPSSRPCDAIILVYDLSRPHQLTRLATHWLPLIAATTPVPVLLVGNKKDLATDLRGQQEGVKPLLAKYEFLQAQMNCSALSLEAVEEVFFMGQSLVLYPMFPLIDVTCNSLQPLCVQALTRMFRVFDVDNDGLLSDSELNAFQNSCFGVSLLPEDVAGLKKIIAKGGSGMLSSGEGGSVESGDLNAMSAQVLTEDEEEGTREGMFTLKGFLSIIKMFIEKNQLQPPWVIMRNFGYNDELSLTIPKGTGDGETLITGDEHRFLTDTFEVFKNEAGVIGAGSCKKIFAVLQDEKPLPPWHPHRATTFFANCPAIPSAAMLEAAVVYDDSFGSATLADSVMASGAMTASMGGSLIIGPGSPHHPAPRPSSPVNMSDSSILIPPGSMMFEAPTLATANLTLPLWIGFWSLAKQLNPSGVATELYKLGLTPERVELVGAAKSTPACRSVRAYSCSSSARLSSVVEANEASICAEPQQAETSFMVVDDTTVVLTEIPRELAAAAATAADCHLAVLVFDTSDADSIKFALHLSEEVLGSEDPRIFLDVGGGGAAGAAGAVIEYCAGHEIAAPLVVAAMAGDAVWSELLKAANWETKVVLDQDRKRQARLRKTWAMRVTGFVTLGSILAGGLWYDGERNGGRAREWFWSVWAPISESMLTRRNTLLSKNSLIA